MIILIAGSCISINYPFLEHNNNNYLAIMKHCRDAIDYINKNAGKWNIGPQKIGLSGSSAGALITELIKGPGSYIEFVLDIKSAGKYKLGVDFRLNIKGKFKVSIADVIVNKLQATSEAKMIEIGCLDGKKLKPGQLIWDMSNFNFPV